METSTYLSVEKGDAWYVTHAESKYTGLSKGKGMHEIDPHSGEVQNLVVIHSENEKRASQEGEPHVVFLWILVPS